MASEKPLPALKKLRSLQRGRLTTIYNYVRKIRNGEEEMPSPVTLAETQYKIKEISEKLSALDDEILQHSQFDETTLDDEAEKIDKYSDAVTSAKAILVTILCPKPTTLPPGDSVETPRGVPTLPTIPTTPAFEILPDIFDGLRMNFRLFMQQFDQFIQNSGNSLNSTQKLFALNKFLRGEPKRIVESLILNSSNYETAVNLLQEMYGNISIEREGLLAKLMELNQVHNKTDIHGLRQLVNHVNISIQTLESLDRPLETYSSFFITAFRAAVPHELYFEFSERKLTETTKIEPDSEATNASLSSTSTEASEIKALLLFITRYVSLRERDAALRNLPASTSSRPNEHHGHFWGHSSKSAKPAPPNNGYKNDPSSNCIFCGQSHPSSRCSSNIPYEDKRSIAIKRSLCTRCLGRNHMANNCFRRVFCRTCKSEQHVTAMHRHNPNQRSSVAQVSCTTQSFPTKISLPTHSPPFVSSVVSPATAPSSLIPVSSPPAVEPPPPQDHNTASVSVDSHRPTFLLTADAMIIYNNAEIPVRVLLDTGSTQTFISKDIIGRLIGIQPVQSATLNVRTFGNAARIVNSKRYSIRLKGTYSSASVTLNAYDWDDISVTSSDVIDEDTLEIIKQFHVLHPLADRSLLDDRYAGPISILVGMDQFFKIVRLASEIQLVPGLTAKESVLGWIIGGAPHDHSQVDVHSVDVRCCAATISDAAQELQQMWDLENIGIKEPVNSVQTGLSEQDSKAVTQFNGSVQYENGRYSVSMPKRDNINSLSNNIYSARCRLQSKLNKLRNDPVLYQKYNHEILAFVRDNCAEEINIDVSSIMPEMDATYYMPHHEVISQGGSHQKWRIVFDCSSSTRGNLSLNDCLLQGPNINPDIVHLILNFRFKPVAASLDVAKAFLQIALHEADRKLLRFLWRPPGDRTRCYQMRRVTWGASCSGYLLAAVLRHHFERCDPENKYQLGSHFYHDDFLMTFDDEAQAHDFFKNFINWMDEAGMKLGKLKTNSSGVSSALKQLGVSQTQEESSLFKILGVKWNGDTDNFIMTSPTFDLIMPKLTKRGALQLLASVYDPLGWLAPIVITGKLIMQQMWTNKLEWDDMLPDELHQTMMNWCREVNTLSELEIPRRYNTKDKEVKSRMLHIFADASKRAYCAVAFIQTNYEDGDQETTFVLSKGKVAPLKPETLPRLELLAAVLAARLKKYIQQHLQTSFDSVSLYTDSLITYHWCTAANPAKWKQFVFNRVTEIREVTSPSEWYFVPGAQNIADFATRGVSASALRDNKEWWYGPKWLSEEPALRPVSQPTTSSLKISPEVKQYQHETVLSLTTHANTQLLNLARHSSFDSACRILANVLEATKRFRKQPLPTRLEMLKRAETILIKESQAEAFPAELCALRRDKRVDGTSKLHNFKIFLDGEGLIRAKTRLVEAPGLSYDEKCPLVISGGSILAKLLIFRAHRVNAHFGVGTVLTNLRKRFWIIGGRRAIKTLLSRCVVCKKRQGQPGDAERAPLPSERTQLIAPFHTTGIDFCGPFMTIQGEEHRKSYVALFTCGSTRAVYLELVDSMAAPAFLFALRRFLSVYPSCQTIISDNAKTFVKAATVIKKLFNFSKDPEVKDMLDKRRVSWKFICPKAPWHGGFYERLVRSVKDGLYRTLGKSTLKFDEFRTLLLELALVINSRPLTFAREDPEDFHPLTPADFLQGACLPLTHLVQEGLNPTTTLSPKSLRASFRRKAALSKSLADRWYKEYLLQLRSANIDNKGNNRPLSIGDVALLKEDNKPRAQWPLVRIEGVNLGRDNLARTYTVRFSNGYVTKRAIQLLIPLELN